jgi:hypothetical protein
VLPTPAPPLEARWPQVLGETCVASNGEFAKKTWFPPVCDVANRGAPAVALGAYGVTPWGLGLLGADTNLMWMDNNARWFWSAAGSRPP